MKKISTLVLMAFFFCLSSMAQVVLGDINFSLGEGKKINPTTGKITVTFPNVTGVADPSATNFVLTGAFNDIEFDGIEGSFASGVTLDLADFELQPATDYALKITSVKVDGTECAAEGGYTLNFKTRGAERKMSWTFTIDAESAAQIVAEGSENVAGAENEDVTKYMDIQKNGATTHRFYVPARNYEEILLPDGTALPMTEDLIFKFGNKAFYVGDTEGSYKDLIAFNGKNQYMTIPDCKVGDIITFNANRATKGSADKPTNIQAMDGAAIAPDGIESSNGIKDSIWLGSSYANYKFEVQIEGDVRFFFNNCLMKSITIEEGVEKLPCKYNVVAAYTEDETTTTLKELVGETEGITGSTIKANYPYWLADKDGNVYTYGTKGNPFEVSFDLKGDTTFVINYKKTDFDGCVFLSEGEDLTGAVLCTNGNAAIRSSMAKSGYVTEDLKLVTLQPGTYKIRAILFDAGKTPSYICTLTKGAGEDDEIYLSATATNWTEAESDLLTITEPTDITLKSGGSESTGVDVIMIYADEDAPEDPDGIAEVKANAQNAAMKVMKNGQLLIKTATGTFNALGVQVK
ncbi:MAG: hypothetical protein IJ929_00710 [Prevotella sp.]|nr:hypothetical protein [Prevotella sp.]